MIGPNGSGKSNLMDAISFVLGVKSSQLRSNQLKELIYRSTSSVNSTDNNIDNAFVTIVYEDDNGEAIRFKRNINGNGTSTYYINDHSVSFSRYSSTLERQNILIKARNFLVFQGDVETIASQSSLDLTRMIEEISGSINLKAEYDSLKDLQEKATQNSTYCFTKKRGINAEIKQFKEQKEEVEKFNELSQKQQDLIVEHLLWKMFHIGDKISNIKKNIVKENKSLNEFKSNTPKIEKIHKDAMRDHVAASTNVLKLEKNLLSHVNKLDARKPELAKITERINHNGKKLSVAENNYNKELKAFENDKSTVLSLEEHLKTLDRSLKMFKDASKQRMEMQGKVLKESEMATYTKLKAELSTKTYFDQQELDLKMLKLKTLEDKLSMESDSLQRFLIRKQNFEVQKDNLIQRRTNYSNELDDVKKELKDLENQFSELLNNRRKAEISRSEIKDKLKETQSKLQLATSNRHESKREQERKEILLSLKRSFPGVYGRVGSLCKPIQHRFETAISVVLGKHLDSIIVENESTAIECIKYLRESRLGTATFLPLDVLDVLPINERLRQISGVNLAIDIIQFEDIYAKAFSFVCGNTVICDDFETAQNVTYNMYRDIKSVTLDGTVIHKNGLITGGLQNEDDVRKFGEKDLDELKRVQIKLLQEYDDLTEIIDSDSKQVDINSNINILKTRMKSLNDILVEIEHEIKDCNTELNSVTNDWEELLLIKNNHDDELNALKDDVSKLEDKIHAIEDELFLSLAKKLKVNNIREYEQRQGREIKETSEKIMKFETEKLKIQGQIDFLNEKLSSTEEKLNNLKLTIENDKKYIIELEDEKTSFVKKNESIEDQITSIKSDLEIARDNVVKKLNAADSIIKELNQNNQQIDNKLKEISNIELKLEGLYTDRYTILRRCKLEEIHIPLITGSLNDIPLEEIEDIVRNNIVNTNNNSYKSNSDNDDIIQIDYSKLPNQAKIDGSVEKDNDYKNSISSITIEMVQLAPNIKANDKLTEVEEKLRETNKEFEKFRRDARDAKESFARVRKQRYELFNNAYNHIVKHIDPIYKELTKSKAVPLGGTAYLSLEDNIEPYNAGIKYHAMPPMKRFQDMGLLSGGEKTVAALALLFAINSYKPSPFFVLDEIDAALDNTNVTKVANYISKHSSSNFQFIVISLKNLFYERAQGLVGIYRDQNENSSKILTLDLQERFTEE